LFEPIALAVHLENVTMMRQAIQQSSSHSFSLKDLYPFAKSKIAGNQQVAPLIAVGKGHGVHWPDIDEDISVGGLLAGRASGESQASFQKWLDQRSSRPTNRCSGRRKRYREDRQGLIKIRVAPDDAQKILRRVDHRKYLDAEATNVFNRLFDKTFKWFDRRVPHNWARDARYKHNIESELERYLKGD